MSRESINCDWILELFHFLSDNCIISLRSGLVSCTSGLGIRLESLVVLLYLKSEFIISVYVKRSEARNPSCDQINHC